jgi:hypothetical protein
MHEKINLKKERSVLTHGSVHGQLVPLLLSLWQGRNTMVDGHGGAKLLTSGQPVGGREGETVDKRLFKVMPSAIQ